MALGYIDYYAIKPFSSPDEIFHRLVSEFLRSGGVRTHRAAGADDRRRPVVAARHALRTLPLAQRRSARVPRGLTGGDRVPRVVQPGGRRGARGRARGRLAAGRSRPHDLAQHGTRMRTDLDHGVRRRDRRSQACGPRGGRVRVVRGPGRVGGRAENISGQAGSSTRIRNYLGFSRGVSGAELMQRAYQQAWVFGATFLVTRRVEGIEPGGAGFRVAISA